MTDRPFGSLPLSPLRRLALDAMRARGVVGVHVGSTMVLQQDCRESDAKALLVVQELVRCPICSGPMGEAVLVRAGDSSEWACSSCLASIEAALAELGQRRAKRILATPLVGIS